MFVTAKELEGFPGLPVTIKGIRESLTRRVAGSPELVRKRSGSKAFEYHIDSLPPLTREEVQRRHCDALLQQQPTTPPVVKTKTASAPGEKLEVLRQCPALLERKVSALTEKQRKIADARCALVLEVLRLQDGGLSRIKAIEFICDRSRTGALPEHVMRWVKVANARKGQRTGVGSRSLNEWVLNYLKTDDATERLALLAPGHHKARKPEEAVWLPRFMVHWNDHNGPTMAHCYRKFKEAWQQEYHDQPAMLAAMPSIYAVRRTMDKLPKRQRLRGRVSGSSARALEVYSRRDWSAMPVNGIWICDGKSLDMKVKHPVSKNAFTPELTLVIDGRTRFVVGWSLSYSENVRGVSEAYRYAMSRHGKPLFVYTDNGPGQKNKELDAEVVGILGRMGVDHMTGIPGNPQARGIIERLNGVIPYVIAQNFETYNGRGADREKLTLLMRAVESAENAESQGKQLNNRQRKAKDAVPEWDTVLAIIEEEIDKYNNSHEHSELPKYNGKHLSPMRYRAAVLEVEGDDIEYPTEVELREMFMPEEVRTVERGWVRLDNNRYFSYDLADHDGTDVRVAYDPRDAREVIVRDMTGAYICNAIWNGNTRAPVAKSKLDRQLEARTKRQLARLDKKAQKIREESRPVIEHKPEVDITKFMPQENIGRKKVHIFPSEFEHEEKLKKASSHR
ncbi:TPA: transposase [Klebsiella oxytoca]|uniref:Mu transposase C-terminal domain-containing protein n=1 Tax=Klebsiella oxytoca TaxID=571 RepID=UPI000CCB1561|nr:transposase [Klebsiella michiganensis]HBM3102605.1 transposase [Klebsiella oxytoca]HBM3103654.1 transposase [Klebsiella oxytoca]HBM3248975.1 transposase [Klebsiella oxytoca]HDS9081005.1 transposase [Klebsiella oxytoca]